VGGYQRNYEPPPTDIDLFMRWTQFGCFTPIMQMHRQLSEKPPNVSHPHGQYPWGYVSAAERANPANHDREFTDNEALRNFRFYAELHTRLFPYIYTFAQESSQTGLPILRPLLLIHPDEPKTFDIKHVYYFGRELVVAPVVERNMTARGVYLPKGRWIDFWTNERIDHSTGGGNHAWANADRTKLPVFAREGAIIPMLADLPQTLCDANYVNNPQIRTPTDGLLVRIYPAATSRFVVHDGTDITCTSTGGAVAVKIDAPHPRPVLLAILTPRPATGVRRDGADVAEKAAPNDFANEATAWRHEPATGILEIKFALAGPTTVTF
jgi:alpha-glucosidase (family GH31 glycosyl hydrolase)